MAARMGLAMAHRPFPAPAGQQLTEFEKAECKTSHDLHDLTRKKEITMADPDIKRLSSAVEDAVAYPILTRETTSNGSDRNGHAGAGGGGSLGRVAQDTIRQVLGWRYRTDDPKGFAAALGKAFALKEVDGHTEWEFMPQSYMVQADLGEITGAQASIHSRARVALDHALPLLDGLTALRNDADEEDITAMRAIIRTEMTELVQELGKVGGPRVQRVEGLFDQLLGKAPNPEDSENVAGHLGNLRDRFGLDRKRVNTIAEEQNLTNFLIVADYVNSIYLTWKAQSKFLDRRGTVEPFLGTQLVLVSQSLEVLSESVHEAYDAMDSVFFGTAERQTTLLHLNGEAPITVAELLNWVEQFAATEGRQLIQDSGKDGVIAFRSTLERLHHLVELASNKSGEDSGNPVRGYHCPRVHRSLNDLKTQTKSTLELTRRFSSPDQNPAPRAEVSKIDPLQSHQVAGVELDVQGANLDGTAEIILKNALHGPFEGDVSDLEDDGFTATFDLTNVPEGEYSLILEDEEGRQTEPDLVFTVLAPGPEIDSVEQLESDDEDVLLLEIKGSHFDDDPPASVRLESEGETIASGEVVSSSETEIEVTFDLSDLDEAQYEVVVENVDGQEDTDAVTIVQPPVIESFTPPALGLGEDFTLTIKGRHFSDSDLKVRLQSFVGAVIDTEAKMENPTLIVATGSVPKDLEYLGLWHVIVESQDRPPAQSADWLEVWFDDPSFEKLDAKSKKVAEHMRKTAIAAAKASKKSK